MKRILFTGCGGMAARGVMRCLRKAPEKFYLVGTESKPENIPFSIADTTYIIPSCDSKKYIPILNQTIKKEKIDLIWIQPQVEVQIISEFREKLLTKIFLPSKKTIKICYDKFKAIRLLENEKFPIPKTIYIQSKRDIQQAFKLLGKKVWLREIKGIAGKGAFLASNEKEAEFWINYNKKGKFIGSEFLPGNNFGCDMLFYDGKLIFLQLKERIAYFLARANIVGITGTTGILKTIENKYLAQLCEQAIRLIDKQPHGVYAIDLKCDASGNPKITEINCGRFLSSSIMLFYMTKFNAPYLTIKMALGEEIPRIRNKYNPIGKNVIMARQLDDIPIVYTQDKIKQLINSKYNYQ